MVILRLWTAWYVAGVHGAIRTALWTISLVQLGCVDESPGRASLAVINGVPSEALSGVAHVARLSVGDTCSGVLIADTLVATAKHCVFESGADADVPGEAASLVVGFGAAVDELETAAVASVSWVGAPDEFDVESAVESGEDVAVLRLEVAAPASQARRSPALAFTPIADLPVRIAGFGISDRVGSQGLRVEGAARVVGADPDTGVVELLGASGCFGDSGGPVLSDDRSLVLGIVSQLGVGERVCDTGRTFASATANDRVRRFFARECAAVGGCGPRGVGEVNDAGRDDTGVGLFDGGSDASVGLDASLGGTNSNIPQRPSTCSCRIAATPLEPSRGLVAIVATICAVTVFRMRLARGSTNLELSTRAKNRTT